MTGFIRKATEGILSFRGFATIGLCLGAIVVINGGATKPALGDSCWDVVPRDCCSTVPNFSFDCGGSLCTSIIEENGDADYKNIFSSGWDLLAFPYQTTYCKYYQAICDYTASAPTCIHEDELSSYSCTDFDPPGVTPSCP